MWIFNQKKHLHFPEFPLTWSTVNGWFFHGFPGGWRLTAFAKNIGKTRMQQKTGSQDLWLSPNESLPLGKLQRPFTNGFCSPPNGGEVKDSPSSGGLNSGFWNLGDLAQIHSSKWSNDSSIPLHSEILSGWRRMELTYLRKKTIRAFGVDSCASEVCLLISNEIFPPTMGRLQLCLGGIPKISQHELCHC